LAPDFAGLERVRVWRDALGDSCTLGRP
jgi:hypothetical protein